MKYKKYFLIILITQFLSVCSNPTSPNDNPEWIEGLISEFEYQEVGNPPQSIWRYTYRDETVYYIPPQCCDQFSILYDSKGNIICAPDGGISGGGDGKCTDFFEDRTDEKLIWKDYRE